MKGAALPFLVAPAIVSGISLAQAASEPAAQFLVWHHSPRFGQEGRGGFQGCTGESVRLYLAA